MLRYQLLCLKGLTENAGHENARHEIAGHDKYRMKISHITLEFAFLLNFKSFVCKASVLTYKKTELRLHIMNIVVFSNCTCIQCTVEYCLQLRQILIVSLLMLHINIVGVVTCSDNSLTLHSSIAAMSASQYKKKTKL